MGKFTILFRMKLIFIFLEISINLIFLMNGGFILDDLVSVIIPTYKRSHLLEKAINSVVNQTYKNIEIIVVDDNSPASNYRKKTEKIMLNYKNNNNIKYIKHLENKNGAAARNTGLKFSEGKYISFLDDDDEFFCLKIEKQVDFIKKSKNNFKAVYCKFGMYNNDKKIYESAYFSEGNLMLDVLSLKTKIFAGSTLLIEKNILEELNGFDESFERHQDYDLLVRFFRKYKIRCVPMELVKINVDNIINRPDGYKLENVKKMFLNKYKTDIIKFNKDKQDKIYSAHYFQLFKVFLKNKRICNALFYLFKSRPDYNMLKDFFNHIKIKVKEHLTNLLV